MDTRWNALYFCIESIVSLRKALATIRDNDMGSDLAKLIPSERQFNSLQELLGPLQEIREMSEYFSADQFPTIHMVIPKLHKLQSIIVRHKVKSDTVRLFLEVFIDEVEKYVPDIGRTERIYNIAAFLNPYFKGVL